MNLWPIGLGRYARHALGIIPGETYREPQAPSSKQQALDKKGLKDYIGEMDTKTAFKIIGGSLSKPSKMPGWSIGLPAKE